MLALTHRHLVRGDYKSQHPPLAARPRPLLKAGPGAGGPCPLLGQVALGRPWQAGPAASLALTQPPALSRCIGVDPFVAGGFLAPR